MPPKFSTEFIIVGGLILTVMLLIMYSRSQAIKPCTDYVKYFDKMYYKLPKLITENKDSVAYLDAIKPDTRCQPIVAADTDLQSSRWAGSVDSQNSNNMDNIREYTNMDISVEPSTLQSGVKARKYLNNSNNIRFLPDEY
jgi:hypothetical protein